MDPYIRFVHALKEAPIELEPLVMTITLRSLLSHISIRIAFISVAEAPLKNTDIVVLTVGAIMS